MGKGRKCWILLILSKKTMARDIFPKLFTKFPHLTNPQQLKQVLQRPVVGCQLVGLMHLDFAHIRCHPLKFLMQKIENKRGKIRNFPQNFQKSQQTKLHKIIFLVGFLVSLSNSSHCDTVLPSVSNYTAQLCQPATPGGIDMIDPGIGILLGKNCLKHVFLGRLR